MSPTSHSPLAPIVLNASAPGEPSGSWDSIHVFEAAERGRQAHYKLTSTIMLQMVDRASGTKDESSAHSSARSGGARDSQREGAGDAKREGEVTLSGSMTRQTEQDFPLQEQASHISNTGRMIEEMEIKMRNLLQEVRRLSLHPHPHPHALFPRTPTRLSPSCTRPPRSVDLRPSLSPLMRACARPSAPRPLLSFRCARVSGVAGVTDSVSFANPADRAVPPTGVLREDARRGLRPAQHRRPREGAQTARAAEGARGLH